MLIYAMQTEPAALSGPQSQRISIPHLEWGVFMYAAYSALLAFFLVLTLPYWLLQMMRHNKYRAGLRQRFGAVPRSLTHDRNHPALWVHAVSVGEVIASTPVIHALQ